MNSISINILSIAVILIVIPTTAVLINRIEKNKEKMLSSGNEMKDLAESFHKKRC